MHRYALPALLTLLVPASGARADAAAFGSISTTGESVIYVTPDEVVVNFGIETFDPDLDHAKSSNDGSAARLVKAIKALGIEEKHTQADNMTIEISYRGRVWEGIAGYLAHRVYAVKLTDPKLFEKLIDAGLKNGANQLLGFEFRTTKLRQYRDDARKMAIQAAKEKAAALASELDCGIGKPRSISESGSFVGAYAWRNNMAQAQNSLQELPPMGEGQSENLPLGQIGVRAYVSVTFDLTDQPSRPTQK